MPVPVYTPLGWVDDTTDLSAANFQHMEQGILDAIAGLGSSKGAFKVGLATATNLGTTATLVPFTDKTNFGGFDPDNWWDSTNRRYNPQRAGYYAFTYNLRLSVAAEANMIWAGLHKNGSLVQASGPWPTGNVANPGNGGAFAPVFLNGSTDYVDLRAWTGTGSRGLSVDASTCWLGGHFIGA